MRVGIILPSLPNYSETFFKSKILGLEKLGHSVSLYVNTNSSYNANLLLPKSISVNVQPNVKNKIKLLFILLYFLFSCPLRSYRFIKLELNSGRLFKAVIRNILINSHILDKQLDWIHFGFATMGIQRENVAKAIGAKSAVSFRGFDIGLYPHQHPSCYNLLWRKIDKVHTISDHLYKQAIDLGLDPKTPYEKITPAIDTEFFKSNVQENLHNPLRILTVGRLTWIKGYEYVLKALSLLQGKQINFEYHIVGEGNYREAILYAIHQLGLTDNIILRGQLSPEKVKDEMEWADIYIQPSIQEGFCNAVLEAQAMGLLCIVTNAEGLSENVLDGKTGWIIPKRNSNLIADKISDVLFMNSDERELISQQAKKRIMKKFDISKLNHSFNNFYKKIE